MEDDYFSSELAAIIWYLILQKRYSIVLCNYLVWNLDMLKFVCYLLSYHV